MQPPIPGSAAGKTLAGGIEYSLFGTVAWILDLVRLGFLARPARRLTPRGRQDQAWDDVVADAITALATYSNGKLSNPLAQQRLRKSGRRLRNVVQEFFIHPASSESNKEKLEQLFGDLMDAENREQGTDGAQHFLKLVEQEVAGNSELQHIVTASSQLRQEELQSKSLDVEERQLEKLGEIVGHLRPTQYVPASSDVNFWLNRPASIREKLAGRETELEAVQEALTASQAVILAGGAGVGKSRLAAEYTYLHGGPQGFWSTAGTGMTQTLAGLAESLRIDVIGKGEENVALEVRAALAGMTDGTLWVVDNLPELAQVSAVLDACGPVRLLATSRDQRRNLLHGGAVFIPLEVLEEDAAVKLLCSRGCNQPDNLALKEIAKVVGYLPLALEMLASRLGEWEATPEGVLEELRRAPTTVEMDVFNREAGELGMPYPQGLYNALKSALKTLPVDVREAVSPLGYVAEEPVPTPLLQVLTGLSADTELARAVGECSRRSVVTPIQGGVCVHALTAAAIVATNGGGALETSLERAAGWLPLINQDHPTEMRLEAPHHERILGSTRDEFSNENRGVYAYSMALAIRYYRLGRFNLAIPMFEEILDVVERELGLEHPDTLMSRNNLAAAYGEVGRNEEEVKLHEATLEIMEQVLGKEHPDTLGSRNNLAAAYQDAGRNQEAIELHKETLQMKERVLGKEHPDTLMSRNNLAAAYGEVGRNEEEVKLHEATLEIMEQVLGKEHPDTLGSRNNLGAAYGAVGRYQERIKLDEETLEMMERVLGRDHPATLASRNGLAIGYGAVGRNGEMVKLDEESLEISERVLGREHPDTLKSRNNLAIAYGAVGRNEERVKLHQETLEIRERVLGKEHPDTLSSRNNLATAYGDVGRHAESFTLHEETMEIMERVLGKEHPDTLVSRNNLAAAYQEAGRNQEAIELHQETLGIRERVLGKEHPDTLGSRNNLAIAYGAVGRDEERVKLHEGTLQISERLLGREHPDTLTSRNNLANAYGAVGRNEDGVKLHRETLEIRERVLGREHPHTLVTMRNLVLAYRSTGRAKEATELEKRLKEREVEG